MTSPTKPKEHLGKDEMEDEILASCRKHNTTHNMCTTLLIVALVEKQQPLLQLYFVMVCHLTPIIVLCFVVLYR
jgi:hypothetical protein